MPGWTASAESRTRGDHRKEFRGRPGVGVRGVRAKSSQRYFDQEEIRALVSRKRTNVWVAWIEIRDAALREGFTASRLRMTLIDGRSVKFLWLPDGRTFNTLRDHLLARIGPNLRIG